MKQLHPDDLSLWERTEDFAWKYARLFNLPLRAAEPKRRPNGALGICYVGEGRISILLRFRECIIDGGRWNSKPLAWDTIAETVAHELAHLRYANHGKQFKQLESMILNHMRSDKEYQME